MIFKNIRKRSKLFSIVSSVILLLTPVKTSLYACAFGPEDEELRYMIFNPDLLEEKQWWTYFYNDHLNYLDGTVHEVDDEQILVKEWAQYLKLQGHEEEINLALFGSVPDSLRSENAFLRALESNKKLSKFYALAQACDSLAAFPDPWRDDAAKEARRNSQRGEMIRELYGALQVESDPFLKYKYAYQLIKMSFYADDRNVFQKTYNEYIKSDQNKVLYWWATHYKSVMLERQENYDSANYLHALVFSHSSAKMFPSKQHFSRENLDGVLALAKDDEEKAAILTLAAVVNPGQCLDVIGNIYELDPNQRHFPLLIVREINKMEDWIGSTKYGHTYVGTREWNEDYNANWKNDFAYATQFRNALAQWPSLGERYPEFFKLALAYTSLLVNDYAEGKKYLAAIKTSDESIQYQVTTLQVIATVQSENIRRDDTQDKIGRLFQKLLDNRKGKFESQKMLYSLSSYLRETFSAAGMVHLAGLFDNYASNKFCYSCEFNSFEYSLVRYYDRSARPSDIADLIKVYDKPKKNALEELLLKPYANKYFFYDVLSVIHLRKGEVVAALRALNNIPDSFWFKYQNAMANLTRDPFKDVSEQLTPLSMSWYNKREIVQRMSDLQANLESSTNRADAAFELANAWYNFSDHSWFMVSYGYSVGETLDPKGGEFAQKKAAEYYTMALKYSNDPERIAKITYMLALLTSGQEEMEYARRYEGMNTTQFYQRKNCLTTADLVNAL